MGRFFILDKRGLFLVKDGSILQIETKSKIKCVFGEYGKYLLCD
jgi:hypothetical protein